jgi:hypothetical protein
MNALCFIPPVFIYPRQRTSSTLEKDGPPGALYKCSKNGWTNVDLFMSWLQHFFDHVKPNPQKPLLLVFDNHYSHITLESYKFCKENGIVIVSIPPHSSHRLQPLDVTFFGPLKKANHRECDIFMKVKAQRVIRPDDFAAFFDNAYFSVATTIAKGISGFKATGIYPLNPNVFTDEDFHHEWEVQDTASKHKIVASLFHSKVLLLFNASLTLLLSHAFPLNPILRPYRPLLRE